MKEQRKIVKDLPDGVIICRHVLSDFNDNNFAGPDQYPSIVMPHSTKTRIKYFNNALKNLLGLKYDYSQFQQSLAKEDDEPLIVGLNNNKNESPNKPESNSINQS